MVLLDTHVLIWFAEDSPKLGAQTVALADAALEREELLVSAISFWEIAMLSAKGRLDLGIAPRVLRQRVIEPGIHEVGLAGGIAIDAAMLPAFHGDPAGRLIVASALAEGATLVTADVPILRWKGRLKRQNARR